jgi:acyl carrier protein
MDEIYEKLTDIFREVFDDPEITINPETTADDIEEWDSMSHINLILMVELKFDIEFKQSEVMRFENVGDLAEAVRGKV